MNGRSLIPFLRTKRQTSCTYYVVDIFLIERARFSYPYGCVDKRTQRGQTSCNLNLLRGRHIFNVHGRLIVIDEREREREIMVFEEAKMA